MRRRPALSLAAGLLTAVLLSACASRDFLAPTPVVSTAAPLRAPDAAPADASGHLNLLYVTDRAPTSDPRTTALS